MRSLLWPMLLQWYMFRWNNSNWATESLTSRPLLIPRKREYEDMGRQGGDRNPAHIFGLNLYLTEDTTRRHMSPKRTVSKGELPIPFQIHVPWWRRVLFRMGSSPLEVVRELG